MKRCSGERLTNLIEPYLSEAGFDVKDKTKLSRVADLIQQRINTLPESVEQSAFAYKTDIGFEDAEAEELVALDSSKGLFKALIEELRGGGSVSGDGFKSLIQQTGPKLNLKGKLLFMPVRAALTGNAKGPDLPLIFDALGQDEVVRRMERYVNI